MYRKWLTDFLTDVIVGQAIECARPLLGQQSASSLKGKHVAAIDASSEISTKSSVTLAFALG
jgi:hypothetical protein